MYICKNQNHFLQKKTKTKNKQTFICIFQNFLLFKKKVIIKSSISKRNIGYTQMLEDCDTWMEPI